MTTKLFLILFLSTVAFGQHLENYNKNQNHNQAKAQAKSEARASATAGGGQGGSVTEARSVPSAYAPTVFATADCRIPLVGGGSGIAASLSLGFTRKDKECEKRELAKLFIQGGNHFAGMKVACATKAAREVGLTQDECQRLDAIDTAIKILATEEDQPQPAVQNVVLTVKVEPIEFKPLVLQQLPVVPMLPVVVKKPVVRKHISCKCK